MLSKTIVCVIIAEIQLFSKYDLTLVRRVRKMGFAQNSFYVKHNMVLILVQLHTPIAAIPESQFLPIRLRFLCPE